MVASYIDSSSYETVNSLIASLNNSNFSLGSNMFLQATTINGQTTVLRDVAVISDSGSGSDSSLSLESSGRSSGLSDSQNSVNFSVFIFYK